MLRIARARRVQPFVFVECDLAVALAIEDREHGFANRPQVLCRGWRRQELVEQRKPLALGHAIVVVSVRGESEQLPEPEKTGHQLFVLGRTRAVSALRGETGCVVDVVRSLECAVAIEIVDFKERGNLALLKIGEHLTPSCALDARMTREYPEWSGAPFSCSA